MAEIIRRKKALSVNPLKSSQTIGAALAFMGCNRSIPMLHGSQGCSAFGKVFFVRHFREPIPLQTTAMDQVTTVMGAYDNVVEGLDTLCTKSKPDIIGVPTTGLSETQGCDIKMAVKEFRTKHPEHNDIPVVGLNTPDYSGCLESGFAAAAKAIMEELVEKPVGRQKPGLRVHQVNILTSAHLTPGDIEEIKDIVEMFGLRPMVFPDLSESLDGHLPEGDYSPLTTGGASIAEVRDMGLARATIVIGRSMFGAADWLYQQTQVPDHRFDHLYGMDAMDAFIMALRSISGRDVPAKLERQRRQLQDAMLDTHFMIGMNRVAVAGDPDWLLAITQQMAEIGCDTAIAVASSNAPSLQQVPVSSVKIGDLEDLELLATGADIDLLIGNSHAVSSAERLGLPILRAGFPQWDLVGGYARTWVGYKAGRQTLFDVANLMAGNHKMAVKPYRSIYGQKLEYKEDSSHGIGAPIAGHSRAQH